MPKFVDNYCKQSLFIIKILQKKNTQLNLRMTI